MILNTIVPVGFIVFMVLVFAVIIVALGSLPGKIARQRNHPQADAINAASWISFVGFGIFWPLALIWAFIKPHSAQAVLSGGGTSNDELEKIKAKLNSLEAEICKCQPTKKGDKS